MKPLIGITTGEIINSVEPWESRIYGQKLQYSDAILEAGGIPVFIPILPDSELRELYNRLDGILFAGGNDISPSLYGEETNPLTIDVTPERDRVEMNLFKWALNDDKPLFAICRGFQMFNVALSGSLYQDLPTQFVHPSDHELSTHEKNRTFIAHVLTIAPESQFASITQSTDIEANTHHHQGIKDIASQLNAVAWSEDGLVEALEHPDKTFAIGVQCHPESLLTTDKKWRAVFEKFINAASKK